LLAAVGGSVDLYGGDGAASVLELARLLQALRIERAAPGLEHPTTDANTNHGPPLSILSRKLRSLPGFHGDRQFRFSSLSGLHSLQEPCRGCGRAPLAPPTSYVSSTPETGHASRRSSGPLWANDLDRGEPLGSAPPTPPYVRVR